LEFAECGNMTTPDLADQLSRLVLVEKKVVTFKTLCLHLSISSMESKKLLSEFVDREKARLETLHLLSGVNGNEKCKFKIVKDAKLEEEKTKFQRLNACHVYSVGCKAAESCAPPPIVARTSEAAKEAPRIGSFPSGNAHPLVDHRWSGVKPAPGAAFSSSPPVVPTALRNKPGAPTKKAPTFSKTFGVKAKAAPPAKPKAAPAPAASKAKLMFGVGAVPAPMKRKSPDTSDKSAPARKRAKPAHGFFGSRATAPSKPAVAPAAEAVRVKSAPAKADEAGVPVVPSVKTQSAAETTASVSQPKPEASVAKPKPEASVANPVTSAPAPPKKKKGGIMGFFKTGKSDPFKKSKTVFKKQAKAKFGKKAAKKPRAPKSKAKAPKQFGKAAVKPRRKKILKTDESSDEEGLNDYANEDEDEGYPMFQNTPNPKVSQKSVKQRHYVDDQTGLMVTEDIVEAQKAG